MTHHKTNVKIGVTAIMLAGCTQAQAPETPISGPGGCIATDTTPAVIETTIEDVLVSPAIIGAHGSITSPAVFSSETRQTIVQERKDVRFPTPCPPVMDENFLATLQRALKARGHYRGPINSTLDSPTQSAIRSYQSANGLNSAILSMTTARALGLLV